MAIVRKRETEDHDPKGTMPPKPDVYPVDYESMGEVMDEDSAHRLSLAFGAVNKFPDLIKRHRRFVGGATATAVISTTAIILAYRAVHGRMAKGESAADALKHVTEEEIERSVSLLRRIRGKK